MADSYERIRRAPYIRWGSFLACGAVMGVAYLVFDGVRPLQFILAWAGAILFMGGQFYVMFTPCPACQKLRFIHFWRSSRRGACVRCGDTVPQRQFAV